MKHPLQRPRIVGSVLGLDVANDPLLAVLIDGRRGQEAIRKELRVKGEEEFPMDRMTQQTGLHDAS
jgi:hypothetical protein